MSDDAVADKAKADVSKQQMWPIFTTGFALAAFGFYFVFAQGSGATEAATNIAEPVAAAAVQEVEATVEEAVTLEPGGSARRLELEVQQSAKRTSGKSLTTTLTFELVDQPIDARDDESFAFRRSFENVRVGVRAGDEVIGADVTNEVVRLLEATKYEVGYAANGERVRADVVSSESAQLRPTLDLMKDITRLVFVPLPAEPVNVGESWSVRIPAEVVGGDVVEVQGGTDVETTLVAASEKDVRLNGSFDGTVRTTWDDAEARRGHVETVVTGEGAWRWSRSMKIPVEVAVRMTRQTLEPDGEQLEHATIVLNARLIEPSKSDK